MAFTNTPNEGVPYYRPVAPEVPAPDNTAARIISAGTPVGISAFVQMALGRERSQLAQQEMLQRADIASRQLDFQREEMQDRHGLTVRGQDIQNQNVLLDYDIASRGLDAMNEVRESQRDLNIEKVNQLKSGMLSATEASLSFAKSMRKLREDADPDFIAAENPEVQTKDPIGFADAVNSLQAQWGTAPPSSGLPARLKALERISDQQKTTLILDGAKKTISNRQILAGLRNPDTYDKYYQGLKDAGHIGSEASSFSFSHPIDSVWNKMFGKAKDVPDKFAKQAIDASKSFDPSKVRNRVGPDVPRSAVDLRAQRATLYDRGEGIEADSSSTPPPVDDTTTETDKIIEQAKLAKAMGKDESAIRALLKSKGIDPDTVDLEGE